MSAPKKADFAIWSRLVGAIAETTGNSYNQASFTALTAYDSFITRDRVRRLVRLNWATLEGDVVELVPHKAFVA